MGRTFDDNRPLVAALLDSIQQAHASRAVVDGVDPTEGAGDWDVDIAAGTVRIDGSGDVSVSAQTVDLADPTSDLAAGEGRIVLVSVDDTGTASATEGAGATDPASPDVPADEVVVWVGFVTEADTSLSTAETWDARTFAAGGENSGIDADVVRGERAYTEANSGSGSGLDADLIDGQDGSEVTNDRVPVYSITGDILIDSSQTLDRENDGATYTGIGGTFELVTSWDSPTPDFSDRLAGTLRVSGSYSNYDVGAGVVGVDLQLRDSSGGTLLSTQVGNTEGSASFTASQTVDVSEYTTEQVDLYMRFENDSNADVTVDYFEWKPNHTPNTYIQ